MLVYLNGEPVAVPQSGQLLDLLASAGLTDLRGVAVAVDGEVLPRSAWAAAVVQEGQHWEVLRAVQGGGR